MDPKPFPEFENPPVVEVVCGIAFSPIPQFTIPYVGQFWAELGADFPSCLEAPPLALVIELPEDDASIEVPIDPAPVPRVWFIHRDGDQIVQLQRDRFLCNWRKTKPEHQYPRYGWISGQFTERLALFERFIEKRLSARVEAKQFELSYINHIFPDTAWRTLKDLAAVLPDFSWRNAPSRFLPSPEAINLTAVFKFPSDAGRLHVRAQSGRRREDRSPVLVLELTARGFLPDRKAWFDLAHEWIVRGFADLTGDKLQSQIWRRNA